MKKLLGSNNFIIVIQIILFFTGVGLFWIDGSGGYIDNMTALSVIGIILIVIAIAFQFILAGVSALFKKKE